MSPSSQSHLDERRQADESHQTFHQQPGLTDKVSSQLTSINIRPKMKFNGSNATG